MPAVIPREGFEQRLASLRELRAATDARIQEIEHWIALLDNIESANAPVPAPQRPPRARRPRANSPKGQQ